MIGYLGRRHAWEEATAKSACQRGLIGACAERQGAGAGQWGP